MQIVINDNGIITAYANVGKLKNGVDFFGEIPADFVPNKYKWQTVEAEIGDNGEEYAHCCILRKDVIKDTFTDENGEEYVSERTESVSEYGEIVINPDYLPVESGPVITEEQRISALEDATAEIIEMLMGGE